MPVIFNERGAPTCCGNILPLIEPWTRCPYCTVDYDTFALGRAVWERRVLSELLPPTTEAAKDCGITIH